MSAVMIIDSGDGNGGDDEDAHDDDHDEHGDDDHDDCSDPAYYRGLNNYLYYFGGSSV